MIACWDRGDASRYAIVAKPCPIGNHKTRAGSVPDFRGFQRRGQTRTKQPEHVLSWASRHPVLRPASQAQPRMGPSPPKVVGAITTRAPTEAKQCRGTARRAGANNNSPALTTLPPIT